MHLETSTFQQDFVFYMLHKLFSVYHEINVLTVM
jgi:hypothetical protein